MLSRFTFLTEIYFVEKKVILLLCLPTNLCIFALNEMKNITTEK